MYDNDDTDKDDHEDEVEDEGVHPESAISALVFRFVDFICGSSHTHSPHLSISLLILGF